MKPTSLFCQYECGLNDYASFDNVIILGREQPAASGMSDQARAMWWDSEEPLRGLQDKSGNLPYMNEPRGYRGIQRGSVQVQVHPDRRAQLLLEQVREAESEQALDRLRLLRGEGKQRQSNKHLRTTRTFEMRGDSKGRTMRIYIATN